LTVPPATAEDAHDRWVKSTSGGDAEPRRTAAGDNDYTIRWDGKFYQIDRRDIRTGMRKAMVRVEQRLDATIAVRFQDQYVRVRRCAQPSANCSHRSKPSPQTAETGR